MTQDQNEQDKSGRKFDQPVSGSNSAGSVGADGTGDSGSMQGGADGAMQSAGRTDDLLSGSDDSDQDDKGFSGTRANQGSRQSAEPRDPATSRTKGE